MTSRTPEDTLRGFYAAAMRDRDFAGACEYVTQDFHLVSTGIVGANVGAGDPGADRLVAPAPMGQVCRGPCAELVARVQMARGGLWPWSAWAVESIEVAADGRTAEAVTTDGSVGLRVASDGWRVAWVHDSG